MPVANAILIVAGVYAAAGLLFAVVFVSFGVTRVDPVARGSSVGFKLLIIPGVAALWPLMLKRWLAARGRERHE